MAVAVALAACAKEAPPSPVPGSMIFQSGSGGASAAPALRAGAPFSKPGILTPAQAASWEGKWVDKQAEKSGVAGGAGSGLLAGMALAQPVALIFWPAAVGVLAGAAVAGAIGGSMKSESDPSKIDPDRLAIARATQGLRPDALLRRTTADALAARLGRAVPQIPGGEGSEGRAVEPREAAASVPEVDGVLDLTIETLGLSASEETEAFGVLVQVRVRALDARSGELRYERVFAHGPTNPIPGLIRPSSHSLDILAMDGARLYRLQVEEIIDRLARHIAADPALPVVGRR
jgi:hypothetical protein